MITYFSKTFNQNFWWLNMTIKIKTELLYLSNLSINMYLDYKQIQTVYPITINTMAMIKSKRVKDIKRMECL